MDPNDRASGISFRQLRLFTALAECGSARLAAAECGLSQSAVTQALAKLEQQVGAALIERRPSGSFPSTLGIVFHARTARLFDQMGQAVTELGAAIQPKAVRGIVDRLSRAQVRTLTGVIEHGSFAQAAAALGLSLSALQRAARDLESNLHVSLFYRSGACMVVSPAGVIFGRRMKLACKEIEWGIGEVEAALGGAYRQIVIGAMPFGGSLLLSSMLDEFLVLYPGRNIRIINDSASELVKSLRDGHVDLIVGLLPDENPDGVTGFALAPTPYLVVARRGHPLMQKGRVELADIGGYDWVAGIAGSSRRACFDRLFPAGARPNVPVETCALTILHPLLTRSDRLMLMTSYELEHATGELRALPFVPVGPVPSIGIMTRTGWRPTRLHTDFIDIVCAQVAALRQPLREFG